MCLYVCARVRVCAVSTTLSVLPPPAVQCQQMTVSGKHLTVLKGKRKTHLTQQTHTSPPPVGSSVYGVSLTLSVSVCLTFHQWKYTQYPIMTNKTMFFRNLSNSLRRIEHTNCIYVNKVDVFCRHSFWQQRVCSIHPHHEARVHVTPYPVKINQSTV